MEKIDGACGSDRGLRMLLVGLRLARDLFGTILPGDIEKMIEADPMVGRLTRWTKDRLCGLDESPLDFYKKCAFYFRIRERARDRVEYLFRMIITALLIEWRPLRLPRSFLPLYYMLRPFRLAKKHGMTLIRQVSGDDAIKKKAPVITTGAFFLKRISKCQKLCFFDRLQQHEGDHHAEDG